MKREIVMKKLVQNCVMLFVVLLVFSFAGCKSNKTKNDFEYSIEDGHAVITNYVGSNSKVTIPKEINDYPVTEIGRSAFNGNDSVTEIELPEGMLAIDYAAFRECRKLKSINLPDSIEEIDDMAFYECTSLEKITLPLNLETISEYLFYGCENLSYIYIPEGVTKIETNAFNWCYDLNEITFPSTIEQIEAGQFASASSPGVVGYEKYVGNYEIVLHVAAGTYGETWATMYCHSSDDGWFFQIY